jgi:hypothetical protein
MTRGLNLGPRSGHFFIFSRQKLSILYLIMFNGWRVTDPDSRLITKLPDLKNTQMSNFFKYSKILETAIAPHTSFLSVAPVLDTLKISILYLIMFNAWLVLC